MLGTRGVPARYGGFETAIEEIGRRLADRGHQVTVYRRRAEGEDDAPTQYLGMKLVTLPAVRAKALETLSHTALSTIVAAKDKKFDAVFMFNAANAVFLPVFRARRTRVAVHVDGLEWKRSKWSGAGQRYYRSAEALSVRWADALIADAPGIASYYTTEFGATTELISYGAPIIKNPEADTLASLEVESGKYHLVVARFEPENHLEMIVRGYVRSQAELPLVVVGGAPYSDDYTRLVHECAAGDDRVRFLGPVWDQRQLDQLYANALVYLHGHSVGGTNPSLLRAIGAGTSVLAFDVDFNRDELGSDGRYFGDSSGVSKEIELLESDPAATTAAGSRLMDVAIRNYDWDKVTDGYEDLAGRLSSGYSRRGEVNARRSSSGSTEGSR